MRSWSHEFLTDGAERHPKALSDTELALLVATAEGAVGERPGTRFTGDDNLSRLLATGSSLDRIARSKLGQKVRPVRAVLFDKSEGANWALGWRQDRTIAVKEKVETLGFGPWSVKAGIVHVEPAFDYIEHMVTLRVHLDPVDEDNAPLLIAPGSHLLGRMPVNDIEGVAERLGSFACLAGVGDVWLHATAIVLVSGARR